MSHTLGITPGPWKATRSDPAEGADVWWITAAMPGIGNSEKTLATIAGTPHRQAQCNAMLVSAAPLLYGACLSLRRHLQLFCGPDDEIAAAIMKMADTAIAAAESQP